uniref:Uncharacterized protein n=1 Tax=Timema cristinae TaxID=61476 RepID=A0A7R9HC31_TIMCR|nr:unnamed protein product [Timema cristinae]
MRVWKEVGIKAGLPVDDVSPCEADARSHHADNESILKGGGIYASVATRDLSTRGHSAPVDHHGYCLVDLQEESTSVPAVMVAPDSPDLLEPFTEDGICLAENDWSMDYWDDGDVAPPPEIDDSIRSQTGVTSVWGYNDILAEIKLLDRLICTPETHDSVQAPLGSQAVVTAVILGITMFWQNSSC